MASRHFVLPGLSALVLAVASPGAWSQASAPAGRSMQKEAAPMRAVRGADRTFVKEAATGGMAEVELGRLAQDKGASDPVRQFGRQMVEDHTKANEELQSIAAAKGIDVPSEPTSEQKRAKARLEGLSGAAFDQAYIQQMVTDHRKTAALLRRESTGGRDAELKAFAGKTLPVVEEHLKMVTSMSGMPKSRTAVPN